ncbi:MAG: hypothetical protein HQL29_06045 [Candidatus Omnitrophica bacterium]|nr:hypothetical protein [Candidatus Omnitrophota bacterium]
MDFKGILTASIKYKITTGILLLVVSTILIVSFAPDLHPKKAPDHFQPYVEYLDKVFTLMDKNYYMPVTRYTYDNFLKSYEEKVLSQLKGDTYVPYVAWRGAHLLVQALRDPKDNFTHFIPPKPAKEYEEEIYGYRSDIGLTGSLTEEGYLLDMVEKRSDSFIQGLRPGDILLSINGTLTTSLTIDQIKDLLNPEIDTTILLNVKTLDGTVKDLTIKSIQYFKETVMNIPTGEEGVFCLQIPKFNRETSNDLDDQLKRILSQKIKLLILDIRGNPGGPPLAVREMASRFLPPNSKLVYYKKRENPVFGLTSPTSPLYYPGPLMVMIDKKSGSSSELFSGILKEYKRALIVGKEPTAGMAFLKGTEKFDDGSMLIMITGQCFLFNGKELDTAGVTPNLVIPAQVDDQVNFVVKKMTAS